MGWAVDKIEFFIYQGTPRVGFYSSIYGTKYELWFVNDTVTIHSYTL